jgi:hypothetical protein
MRSTLRFLTAISVVGVSSGCPYLEVPDVDGGTDGGECGELGLPCCPIGVCRTGVCNDDFCADPSCGEAGCPGPDAGEQADSGCPLPPVGEGTICSLSAGNCPTGMTCTNWSPYPQSFGVCRTSCSQGCGPGESCGQDGTCQCQPAAFCGASGDSCSSAGNGTCHPDFLACVTTEQSCECTSPLIWSPACQLCRPE